MIPKNSLKNKRYQNIFQVTFVLNFKKSVNPIIFSPEILLIQFQGNNNFPYFVLKFFKGRVKIFR